MGSFFPLLSVAFKALLFSYWKLLPRGAPPAVHPAGSPLVAPAPKKPPSSPQFTLSFKVRFSISFKTIFRIYFINRIWNILYISIYWIWTWGEAVHLRTTSRLFGRSQGRLWSWLWLSCAPETIIIIIMVHARIFDYNYCCQHVWEL